MTSCGCPKPAIHWSSDFNARMCQNCGVILMGEAESINEHDERLLDAPSNNYVLEERERIPSNDAITADAFGETLSHCHSPESQRETLEAYSDPYLNSFVHLRVHTHLSMLKATCKPSDLIKKAKEYGMPALAKTEFGNLFGAPTFVKDCQEEGIKPILGVEFDVKVDVVTYPITFIAMNRNGYKQLVKMTTTAWCERKTKNDVFINDVDIPVSQDLVAMVDFGGDFNIAGYMLNIVKPRMETYIEVNTTRQKVIDIVNQVSQQTQTPVLVTGNVLYTNEDEVFAYGVGREIGKHAVNTFVPEGIDNWFKPPVLFGSFFEHAQPWVTNTMSIAQRVEDYGLVNKEFIVPTYKNEGKEYTDFDETHRQLEIDAWRGIYEKGRAGDSAYIERLQYELNIMKDKKFSSYFLLISEIVSWMKRQGIMVPFGRGSSVGSLVCYALDIITMDPIRWQIPFERFIHSGRKDLPDIDTDISQERRSEVLAHIADVHGRDRVAHIATYQTMALRAAIENVGRVLGIPHGVNRNLRKIIPDDVNEWDNLDLSIQEEIKNMMGFEPEWLPIALALTGTVKNLGFHAAGVVISNDSFGELVPLLPSPEEDGLLGIQYDMYDCEVLGLLKLDMLGLRNIDIIQHAVDRIKVRHGINLDVYNLPADDAATFDLVAKADYVSVFQLDSTGYRRLCKQLSPRNFEHLMALNALFRPGPLESGVTDQYVERRHGRQAAVSWHPWLDEVLNDTYQTVLFQEQAMAMSRIIAGFSDVEADKFRKGIGKKIPEVVDACIEDFKVGAMKMPGLEPPPDWTGTLESWIDDLTEKLHGYARYMWNRGHSCGYGWITYVTAYLEAHYPSEYYASLLDAFRGNNKKLPTLLRSIIGGGKCKVFPPNINQSYIDYEVGSDGNIYMGLAAIRNVGKSAPEIVTNREQKGPFTSFINFCQRMPSVNKTAKVNLVKSGAFAWDKMLCDRDKIDNVDIITKWAKKKNKKFDGSKVSSIEIAMKLEGVNGYEYTDLEISQNERESLNSFITGHPAAIYHRLSDHLERGNTRIVMPVHIANMECEIGESVLVVGMVDYIYRKQTRENPSRGLPSRPYLNVSISDSEGYIITNIWWPLCEDLQKILVSGEIAMFECIVKEDKFRDDRVMLRVDNAINLSNGLPVQGVFRLNGYDPGEVVNHIGGIVNNVSILGPRKYASIRGRITIQPHLLNDAVNNFGDDIKYLISMDSLE